MRTSWKRCFLAHRRRCPPITQLALSRFQGQAWVNDYAIINSR